MEMRFPTRMAIDRLNRELALPALGNEQDWDIELADANRLDEFARYYTSTELDDDERFALLCLMVASAQDRLASGRDGEWLPALLSKLRDRADLASPILSYWTQNGEWEIAAHLRAFGAEGQPQ